MPRFRRAPSLVNRGVPPPLRGGPCCGPDSGGLRHRLSSVIPPGSGGRPSGAEPRMIGTELPLHPGRGAGNAAVPFAHDWHGVPSPPRQGRGKLAGGASHRYRVCNESAPRQGRRKPPPCHRHIYPFTATSSSRPRTESPGSLRNGVNAFMLSLAASRVNQAAYPRLSAACPIMFTSSLA